MADRTVPHPCRCLRKGATRSTCSSLAACLRHEHLSTRTTTAECKFRWLKLGVRRVLKGFVTQHPIGYRANTDPDLTVTRAAIWYEVDNQQVVRQFQLDVARSRMYSLQDSRKTSGILILFDANRLTMENRPNWQCWPNVNIGYERHYRFRRTSRSRYKKIGLMNTQHYQRRKNNNTIKCRDRSAKRFPFSVVLWS